MQTSLAPAPAVADPARRDSTALPPLRPMTMGEILDRALGLFRSSFLRLFTVMLVFQAPMYALQKSFQTLMQQKAPVLARPGAFRGALPDAEQLAWFFGGAAVLGVVTLALYQLAVAALATGAARGFLGERIEPGRALREAFTRAPQVLGTFLLLSLWTGLLLTLSIAPGAGLIAGGFLVFESAGARIGAAVAGLLVVFGALLVVGLYLMLRYVLVTEVVMIEKLSFVRALRRSARLMAGRVGPTFFDNCKVRASIVLAVTFCISISVAIVASLPSYLVYAAFDVSPFNPESFDPSLVPLWAMLPVEAFAVFCQTAVAPYGLLATIVFYFDVRIKREGFDLEFLATHLAPNPSR
ncbi:MAG TPA: hypothetical protein DFS52_32015 [Myxococcales bacterium]|nr:hypothetical protein [Myxococcales bacterium]